MKKIYLLPIIIGTLACAPVSQALAQDVTLRGDYTQSAISRSDDRKSLNISFTIAPDFKLSAQEVVYIYPRLVSNTDASKSYSLEPIAIAGRARKIVLKRQDVYGNTPANLPSWSGAYLSKSDLRQGRNSYTSSIPFADWMRDARLEVDEKVYGCAECGVQELVEPIPGVVAKIQGFGPELFSFAMAQPKFVEPKLLEEEIVAYVNYRVDDAVVLKDYKDNNRELKRMLDFAKEVISYNGAVVNQFALEGYASPEASEAYNLKLSDRRVKALAKYLFEQMPELEKINDKVVAGRGENWAGLRKALVESNRPDRDQLVAIIDKYDTDVKREADIKALNGGATYRELLNNFYPDLRRTTMRMKMTVRGYNEYEYATVFAEQPKLLSSYELFKLAKQYEAKGQKADALKVYETAHKLYGKDDVKVTVNYALALMEADKTAGANAAKALEVLRPFATNPEAKLAYAMALYLNGDQAGADKVYFAE